MRKYFLFFIAEEATEETPIATETAPHQSFSVLKKRRSEHLDNAPTLIRQSTRHRIPNRLFDFIVPGFLSIEKGKEGGNKKESDKGILFLSTSDTPLHIFLRKAEHSSVARIKGVVTPLFFSKS